jgi:hypothetical protein
MMNDNHVLLMELWSRIKSHIVPKERLEVADILVTVFDEFNLVDEDLLEEDLDKELRAAARSHLATSEEELEIDGEGEEDDPFGY